jgi:hypothetical protein
MIPLVAILLVAAQSATPQGSISGGPVGPHADVVFATAFLTDANAPWLDIEWREKPGHDLIAQTVPVRPGRFGMVELRCEGFTLEGKLLGCKVRDDPQEMGYHGAGEKLATSLSATEAFRKKVEGHVRFVSVQLRLSNSDTNLLSGPCWPPTCIVEPGPPPPPTRPSVR